MHPLIRETGRWVKRTRLRALRAATSRKAHYNALLNQRELWQGRTRLAAFPREIQVGTNWTCNLRCCFCERETTQKERLAALSPAERELPREVLDQLIAVMPYAELFSLTPLGEPLIYSGFDELLERHRALGCRNLQITTNAQALDAGCARRLVESGVRRIYVSVDTADPERYAAMRVGGRLDRVTRALDALAEERRRAGGVHPEVILASTFLERNIRDLPALVAYAADHEIAKLSVQFMEPMAPEFEPEALTNHIDLAARCIAEGCRVGRERGVEIVMTLALRNVLSRADVPEAAELIERERAFDTRHLSLIDQCAYPWTYLMVDTDGEARPCCWTSIVYGNLREQGFDEVWNGAPARRLRSQFLQGVLPAGCREKHCRVVPPANDGARA